MELHNADEEQATRHIPGYSLELSDEAGGFPYRVRVRQFRTVALPVMGRKVKKVLRRSMSAAVIWIGPKRLGEPGGLEPPTR